MNGMMQRTTATIFGCGALALLAFALMSWRDGGGCIVPRKPDYSDSTQWYVIDRGKPADLFYIVSTETGDYVVGGDTCHYADTWDPQRRKGMLKEMRAVDSLFGRDCNYVSPFYRQITMQSWAVEDSALARLPLALGDAQRSWDYYLNHLNHGRPFILAGFSQGAHAMLDIMKHMPDSVGSRLVAAYCIGYKISQQTLDSFPQIRPAQGATDVGVTINYNSVCSAECFIPVVSGGNVVNINPVNWRTDTVRATFVNYGRRRNDTLSVYCDTLAHLCIVDGYHSDYVMPSIGVPGNYHHMELRFYYPYLRKNIADRVRAFLEMCW